ncbi:MAG: hypothetical protein HC813_01720 [Planctomycetes bacterium]|nr:hypothetical protein [Planctomycetota bacterium]
MVERAGRIARTLLEIDPAGTGARDIVAASLLRDRKWADVLALYEGVASKSADGYARVVGALVMLERKDEALALARESRDVHPGVPLPYAQLAQLYIDRQMPNEALRVLSIAPNNPYILHLRADLLLQAGGPRPRRPALRVAPRREHLPRQGSVDGPLPDASPPVPPR